jgi:RsiW-degrading membrane proteinase PrsW (M82 family)
MAEQWFYVSGGERRGPLDTALLTKLIAEGGVDRNALVWRPGLAEWTPAASVPELASVAPPPPPLPQKAGKGFLSNLGARISTASELPTISGMPVREILVGGLQKKTASEDIEEEFIVGTRSTTPDLSAVATTWPAPRVFWRILAGALATYFLLYLGVKQFGNSNFVPGLIVIGSFVVPFSVVVLFFELNVPKNVSIYQVGKMLMLGGALSLIATMFLFDFIPGSGVGAIVPAMLTGVIEETGKALALLIVLFSARYRWQLNGLLFGAAVGAGFAGFESAGYALRVAFDGGMDAALGNITLRALLSPGGHVIWTAMVGSAIWRVKGDRPFRLDMLVHRDVVRRWAIAVILHGLWDADLYVHPYIQLAILVVVGWYIVLAILKQALEEVAAAKAKLAPAA